MSGYTWVRVLGNLLAALISIASAPAQLSSPWVLRESGTAANLWGVAVQLDGSSGGNTRIVAVGEQGTIVSSVDGGATWTRQVSGTDAWLIAVCYISGDISGHQFLAVGDRGTILSSPDGVTWTQKATPTAARLNAVRPGNVLGMVIAVGEPGGARYRSPVDARGRAVPAIIGCEVSLGDPRSRVGVGGGARRCILCARIGCGRPSRADGVAD